MDDRLARTVATYEANAAQYARTNDDRAAVDELLATFLDALEGDRVLDVGCGPGWETAAMAEAGVDVVGLDISAALLAEASDRADDADLLRGDMRSLPVDADGVDGVWACASLLHVPREQLPATLAELSRVLRPGGLFVATVKSETFERRTDDYDGERHFEYYRAEEFRDALERQGFEVVALRSSDVGWLRVRARADPVTP